MHTLLKQSVILLSLCSFWLMVPEAAISAPGVPAPTAPTVAPVASPRAPAMPQGSSELKAVGSGATTGMSRDGEFADAGLKTLNGLVNKITGLENAPKEADLTTTPVFGSADTNGGYGAHVLEKLLTYWQPPTGASGVVTISLRIGSDGRPLYCETTRRSGNPLLDELPCQAALRAGSFGAPPYGAVTEVFLTLATDRAAFGSTKPAATEAQRSYAEEIMHRVKPQVQVPLGLGGVPHTVELRLRLSGTGNIEELSVTRSSGRQDVDKAVMTALLSPGILPPLPADSSPQDLRLLFTIVSN